MSEMVVNIVEGQTVIGKNNKQITGEYPCSKKEGDRLIRLGVAELVKSEKAKVKSENNAKTTTAKKAAAKNKN